MPGLRAFSTSLLALVAVAPGAFADFFGPNWFLETDVHIQRLAVTMKVPAIPSNLTGQTLFIWPGIQPGNALDETNGDPAGVGNGVLQPVLTWGLSCAPGTQPDNQWWISAQYVNTYTSNSEFSGCFGGDLMALQPDDLVECTMELENGTVAVWNQTCVNQSNDESVSFQFDLDGQLQSWGELIVETTNEISLTNWDFPAFFYNLEFTTDNVMAEYTCIIPESDPGYVSKDSALSADGLTCTLGGIGVFNPSVLGVTWTGPSWYLAEGTHITKLATTMKVPAIPANDLDGQTLFIWPGIQPGNALNEANGDPAGVGNGVLQPVLTYGPSCVPGDHPEDQWYISGVYVGVNGDYNGCFGGDVMEVDPEDLVACTMQLKDGTASTWDQTCVNLSNNNQTLSRRISAASCRAGASSSSRTPPTSPRQTGPSLYVFLLVSSP
ncbi:hypothetical protein BD626DRAFT_391053 [Schizophyllum amplum]|uniref:Ig-like domain-containing protein n=1 Tax=Schizophyllum amplum TaxID=97359 RepID=A0A550CXS0_9AGAR|nr:hypothetical protein BD626DRAFT_391053 [Auriculariopsis ampla]